MPDTGPHHAGGKPTTVDPFEEAYQAGVMAEDLSPIQPRGVGFRRELSEAAAAAEASQ